MLTELAVKNLVLIEDARLTLAPGLNVLTGETGAGKSIVAGGLALIAGARSTKRHVRSGAPFASVEASFALEDSGLLELSRTITCAGRSRCAIGQRRATLPELAQAAGRLIEITSQHAHHSLCAPRRQLELLDAFAGQTLEARAYRALFAELETSRAELGATQRRRATRERELDRARHELEELNELAPVPGELTALQERVELLRGAKALGEIARAVSHVLTDDDAGLSRLTALARRIERTPASCLALARLAEALGGAISANEQAAHAARLLVDELDGHPGELAALEERRGRLLEASRRHGVDCDLLPRVQRELEQVLATEAASAETEHALAERVRELHASCRSRALALHRRRVRTAPELSAAIEKELSALCMASARFEVRCERAPELSAAGASSVELLLAANPGEPMAPLARVASGGELSRVLLAIESAVSEQSSAATRVFDEVDAGVGGTVADAIGSRLARMARQRQIVCVTHLPQIAAFAEAHFVVEKEVSGGRTVTQVRRLSEHEREAELARMLGGSGQSARAHARTLLERARSEGPRGARHASGRRPAALQVRAV